MSFRYVNKTDYLEMSLRYLINKIRLGDDFQIRKQNWTWECPLDT